MGDFGVLVGDGSRELYFREMDGPLEKCTDSLMQHTPEQSKELELERYVIGVNKGGFDYSAFKRCACGERYLVPLSDGEIREYHEKMNAGKEERAGKIRDLNRKIAELETSGVFPSEEKFDFQEMMGEVEEEKRENPGMGNYPINQ